MAERSSRAWCAGLLFSLGALSCAGHQPSELGLANQAEVVSTLEALTAQYESFGAPKSDVTACRHKFTAVRDATDQKRWDEAESRLKDALACTRAVGDEVARQLDSLRANDHLNMDLKVLIGRDLDFGQGLYKLVRINWTPKGDTVRYDLELRAIPSGLLRTYSFSMR